MKKRILIIIAILVIPAMILLADHYLLHEDISIQAGYDSSPQWQKIVENQQDYPDELLDLALRNKETIPFVADYPTCHDQDVSMNLAEDLKSGKFPLLLQWDKRWGYRTYGDSMMAINGCGPTCLSMVVSYLTQDPRYNPYMIAQYAMQNGYYTSEGTSWSLMLQGAEAFKVSARQISLDEQQIIDELTAGHPIICSVKKGLFTSTGHFIVLTAYQNGKITVHDPNSRLKSKDYDFADICDQIKNLWAYRKNSF